MSNVIVQIEGEGAFRLPAALAADILETNREDKADVYIVDAQGRTWAPLTDSWVIWEDAR
jgi:hypothetical protein